MTNNIITEDVKKWSSIINEELGVKDQNKLAWMSQYARNHEVYEAVQANGAGMNAGAGIYATPLNTLGMGNPMMPQGVGYGQNTGIGNTGSDFHNPNYKVGSGDIPMSTLTMSLEVAAQTIGLELVPVIPANGPFAILQYMDFPYAGGKLGKLNETVLDGKGEDDQNKPIYIKINYKPVYALGKSKRDIADRLAVQFTSEEGKQLNGVLLGFSRIDNSMIIKVKDCGDAETSIADVMDSNITLVATDEALGEQTAQECHAELVSGSAEHIQEFSNFFGKDGKGTPSDEPMSRAENETGVGNTIGARFFTKMIQMGSYEVTGSVTRQQLQDMPLYGIDVIGKVLAQMQNQISQSINNRILDRMFKLGVTNAIIQKEYQNVDLNLYFGAELNAKKDLKKFSAYNKFVDIYGHTPETWGEVHNATQNTSAENVTTHQRRIMSRCRAAANLIANVSRFGRASWIVTNTQILSALQDCAGFVIAPMVNTLTQDGSGSLYMAGSIAGLNVYVDPYMTWEDTRILVGRKSNGETPGVVFMPYILADTVQTIVEGTMAPKLLVNSRFAIVDAGFHPEQNYLTFMVDADGSYLL